MGTTRPLDDGLTGRDARESHWGPVFFFGLGSKTEHARLLAQEDQDFRI